MKAKRGFTLVEILIVVVILGILAAIVVPQFTQASTEAKENSLCSNLQSLRSQIQLYKVQHNDTPPDDANLVDLVYCTNVSGAMASTPSKERDTANGYIYGPYLERVPDNPFNNLDSVRIVTSTPGAAAGTHGWVYDSDTGEIWADNTGADENGTDYFDY
jgi:general secretion pathway protein G